MLQNIKAVLFDLDGTLVDSMWVWKQIDLDYLGSRNIRMPESLQKDIEGMSMRETAKFFQQQFAITDSIDVMMAEWNAMAMETYAHKVTWKPGAKEFLMQLKERGIATGIATSNSKELLKAVSDALSMDTYIDCYLTGNELNKGKPAPDIYLEVANRLQVLPQDCLVFEDICPGIMAAKNAGMKVCAIYDDYSKDITAEKKALADAYIDDYTQIDWTGNNHGTK